MNVLSRADQAWQHCQSLALAWHCFLASADRTYRILPAWVRLLASLACKHSSARAELSRHVQLKTKGERSSWPESTPEWCLATLPAFGGSLGTNARQDVCRIYLSGPGVATGCCCSHWPARAWSQAQQVGEKRIAQLL